VPQSARSATEGEVRVDWSPICCYVAPNSLLTWVTSLFWGHAQFGIYWSVT